MFHGIVQQIAYDLGQSLFVRIEHDLVIGNRDAGPDSLLLHLLGKLQHTSFQQIVQIHIRPIERESRSVDFLKIEQLIRQIQQPVDIGTHDFEVLLIIRRPDPRADDLFVRPPDQRQRSSYFMGYIREKRDLRPVFLPFLLPLQFPDLEIAPLSCFTHVPADIQPDNHDYGQHVHDISHRRGIKWRANLDFKPGRLIVPHSGSIGSPDLENIFPGRHIGEGNTRLFYFNPVINVVAHDIPVLIPAGGIVAEHGKIYGKQRLVVPEFDFIRIRHGGIQRRSRAADLGRPVVQLQIGHYDRSEIGARYELLRRKAHKTVDRAEIEFAVQIPESRLIVELIAGQPVAGGINFQVPRQRFITGQPLVRTDPQIFIFILDHFIHDIVRESVPGRIRRQIARRWRIAHRTSSFRTEPDMKGAVLIDADNMFEKAFIPGFHLPPLPRMGIIGNDPPVIRGEIDDPVVSLINIVYEQIFRDLPHEFERPVFGMKQAETVSQPHPNAAVVIPEYRENAVVGKHLRTQCDNLIRLQIHYIESAEESPDIEPVAIHA